MCTRRWSVYGFAMPYTMLNVTYYKHKSTALRYSTRRQNLIDTIYRYIAATHTYNIKVKHKSNNEL